MPKIDLVKAYDELIEFCEKILAILKEDIRYEQLKREFYKTAGRDEQ